MVITLTWGLIVMVIVSLMLIGWMIQQMAEHGDWGILTCIPIFLFMVFLWCIYGGVAWW